MDLYIANFHNVKKIIFKTKIKEKNGSEFFKISTLHDLSDGVFLVVFENSNKQRKNIRMVNLGFQSGLNFEAAQ